MADLQKIEESIEQEIMAYLRQHTDPKIRHLIAALDHVRGARHSAEEAESSQVKDAEGSMVSDIPVTRGDACVEALQQANRPLHIDDLVEYVQSRGIETTRAKLVGILKRDSLNRFINRGRNVYTLNHSALALDDRDFFQSPDGTIRRRRKYKIAELGVTLKDAILKEIASLDGAEFDQPTIYNLLIEHFPHAAATIQKTAITVTLNNLSKAGIIETAVKGKGPIAKRYKKKTQIENLTLIRSNNELAEAV